ncbi:MAG: ATP-binding cassette domain-containing protein [Planctomycetales bacterium]|nr:ATP-binding cassette domain-containing protein [Planctomycetales bacterium]NIM09084.1 ATP-binding cassette domain-containing protein [Planctomycetales bacterium]NIN08542.1 ATP-binding cassette domain-containing protein [Planctomycetales bacterium]NIN77676.1 ATP-binding cassette domain-containing protein [Planctomycetales bacterium]NIO34842.1 ATP-binding cassette domain-containing protein [Planctomycetales bacterium]
MSERPLNVQPAAETPAVTPPLLEVRDLEVHFPIPGGGFLRQSPHRLRAVDGVSLTLTEGETLGLVGESGCGKSTLARAILNLVPLTSGEIRFAGRSIGGLAEREMRQYRQQMQMIFQDPFASLNPRMTVGNIIGEPMQIFGLHPPRDRKLEVMRLMELVGLNPRFLNRYPHEFSGGQRQRIGIARALAVHPKVILCDEPVSALDVSIQAQVINLLTELQDKLGLAYLFIAHDLAVVRHIADRVGVMYLGRLVEVAPAADLYANPRHPYTRALLSSVPTPDPQRERRRERMVPSGEVPSPDRIYPGCRFADRCVMAAMDCLHSSPPLAGDDHQVACFFGWDEPRYQAALRQPR